jgi:hypothetical protein
MIYRIISFITLLCAASIPASAQKFGFNVGVKGGVSLTNFLQSTGVIDGSSFNAINKTSDYLIGPAVEVTIPFGFAIEADGLYHKAEYKANLPVPIGVSGTAWEVPYLAKFRFPIPLIKPFILGGGAWRNFTDKSPEVSASKNAIVLGAGVELKIKKLRLSGEFRYLHWGSPSSNAVVRAYQNQGEFLMGVLF